MLKHRNEWYEWNSNGVSIKHMFLYHIIFMSWQFTGKKKAQNPVTHTQFIHWFPEGSLVHQQIAVVLSWSGSGESRDLGLGIDSRCSQDVFTALLMWRETHGTENTTQRYDRKDDKHHLLSLTPDLVRTRSTWTVVDRQETKNNREVEGFSTASPLCDHWSTKI
jgi:hypothetical protein